MANTHKVYIVRDNIIFTMAISIWKITYKVKLTLMVAYAVISVLDSCTEWQPLPFPSLSLSSSLDVDDC